MLLEGDPTIPRAVPQNSQGGVRASVSAGDSAGSGMQDSGSTRVSTVCEPRGTQCAHGGSRGCAAGASAGRGGPGSAFPVPVPEAPSPLEPSSALRLSVSVRARQHCTAPAFVYWLTRQLSLNASLSSGGSASPPVSPQRPSRSVSDPGCSPGTPVCVSPSLTRLSLSVLLC